MKYSTPDIPPMCHGELNVIKGKIRKEKGLAIFTLFERAT